MVLQVDVLEESFKALAPRGDAFVAADWMPALEQAWASAYAAISATMLEGASPSSA